MELKDLSKEMPYQWRVQAFSKFKPAAQCVAYIDARDVMVRLDEVCGAENWMSDFKEVAGKVYAGIGIRVNDIWVWKWDVGDETDIEAAKGQASDAFKRAGVKWGIGRFLYDLPIFTVKSSEIKADRNSPHVVDGNGERVWDLTAHIDKLRTFGTSSKPVTPSQTPKTAPGRTKTSEEENREKARKDRILANLKRLGKSVKTKEEIAQAVFDLVGMELVPEKYDEIGEALGKLK